jgi:2-C-methyl-D-erythritol 2,4-cyclodiphosphate synthase
MRVGIGYDVHRLVKQEKLVIGGVLIPASKGLKGHSDADVLTHALIDAVLGALGLGDIGDHFPDTAKEYKDVDSLLLLRKVTELLSERNFKLGNADMIIMAEKPKLASYKKQMIENYKKIFDVKAAKINIKATTTEGLGFVGKNEGVAAQAIVSII